MKKIIKKYYFKYKYNVIIRSNCNISMKTKFGRNVIIENNTVLSDSILGEEIYIGPGCNIYNSKIDSYTSIGPRVTIGENEHILHNISTCNSLLSNEEKENYFNYNNLTTLISSDVWIGEGAFIKKGIKIGVGAVIGARTVVTKDVPDYSIVVGIPGRVIKYRFNKDLINALLSSEWWKMNSEDLRKIFQYLSDCNSKDNITNFCELVNKKNVCN